MTAKYDTIGVNYANLRQPDARIGRFIADALGEADTVLNVGAGAGSYEPADRTVTALEPSAEMIRQRPASAAPCRQGRAEALPFTDKSFDASMAVLTIHHWTDQAKGLAEMRRVTRGPVVLLTFDTAVGGFWLTDYLPQIIALDEKQMPPMDAYARWLAPDRVAVTPVPIPHDCTDGFLGAYWRRPAAYLDDRVRGAISCFWSMENVAPCLARLAADLDRGAWDAKYGALRQQETLDLGYRLIVARPTTPPG